MTYGNLYLEILHQCVPRSWRENGLRLWELGGRAGMNLLHLVALLERSGMAVDCAYGTDFSEPSIAAAHSESRKHLTPAQNTKVHFAWPERSIC